MIDVALLGTGGTLPLPGRYLSSALIRFNGKLIILDCGEGTQISLRELGWGLKDIGHILITHFHADHISGLPGLLLTIGNSGRTSEEPLWIIGPKGIQRVVEHLRIIAPHLPFPIRFKEMFGQPDDTFAIDQLQLTSALGEHDLTCLTYRFDLARAPQFQPERARALGLPVQFWKVLQHGESVEFGGRTILPQEVLGGPRAGLSLGFLTDSRPTERLVEFFSDVDLLITEATYGDPSDKVKAIENKHMTFTEAAMLGAAARVKRLWFTHFSPSLPNPEYFRKEAESVFPEVVIGKQHLSTTLVFQD
jgi:ribonuclease Z